MVRRMSRAAERAAVVVVEGKVGSLLSLGDDPGDVVDGGLEELEASLVVVLVFSSRGGGGGGTAPTLLPPAVPPCFPERRRAFITYLFCDIKRVGDRTKQLVGQYPSK